MHGLVGPNGAGKTTLLGLLLGLAEADGGDLEILGSPVRRTFALPDGVAGFVDGPGLYPSLTARQNLAALARLRGAALLTRPRLLVLDEPANGLDPAGTRHVHRVLTGLAAHGTAVVVSSHRMGDLAALCSEVTVLATGRVVFSGPVSRLAADTDELDYRLRTSDPAAARRVAGATPEVRVLYGQDEALVVRAAVPALDDLVARLVGADVGVRELAPVVAPLEAAFLALTTAATLPSEDADL
jgi:ABC-2 type transport system ATP-binding protein